MYICCISFPLVEPTIQAAGSPFPKKYPRMMETGYQNISLANLFGLPYVVVRKPTPLDTKTLNYNWQNDMTAAFSVYTGTQ